MRPCLVPVRLGDNSTVWAKAKGDVVFKPSGSRDLVVFSDVLYVPRLKNNLFSILTAVKKRKMRVVIENDTLDFSKDGNSLFTATIHGTTGLLDGTTLGNDEAALSVMVDKSILHDRLGHIGIDRLDTLIEKKLADGVAVKKGTEVKEFCEACILGKQHRRPFPKVSEHRCTEVLGRIHSDLHGPLPRTAKGHKYWITFTDDHCRFKRTYLLKKKSEAFDKFKIYVAAAENYLGVKVKELRDDKGGEYMSAEFAAWCDARGISRQHTVKGTPQQNGVSERLNRTLAEGVIAMINHAGLSVTFWSTAVLYYTDILNVTPTDSLSDTTSYEVWHKRKPDLSMFKVYGCRAFVNVARADRKNLDSHTIPCIFLGFAEGYKGWLCYDPATRKTHISRDVIFDETSFPGLSTKGKKVEVPPVEWSKLWSHDDDESSVEETPSTAPDVDATPKPPAGPAPSASHPDSDESDDDDDAPQGNLPNAPAAPSTPARAPPKDASKDVLQRKRAWSKPQSESSPTPRAPKVSPSSPTPAVKNSPETKWKGIEGIRNPVPAASFPPLPTPAPAPAITTMLRVRLGVVSSLVQNSLHYLASHPGRSHFSLSSNSTLR